MEPQKKRVFLSAFEPLKTLNACGVLGNRAGLGEEQRGAGSPWVLYRSALGEGGAGSPGSPCLSIAIATSRRGRVVVGQGGAREMGGRADA